MPWTTAAGNNLLLHLFNNADWANVGDAAGLQNSATAGNFYVSLHTADPGAAGNQTTSEANYTGYARQAVARASGAGGWTVTNNEVVNFSAVLFGQDTSGTNTLTYVGIGTDSSGAGNLIGRQQLNAQLIVNPGITPQFASGALKWTAPTT